MDRLLTVFVPMGKVSPRPTQILVPFVTGLVRGRDGGDYFIVEEKSSPGNATVLRDPPSPSNSPSLPSLTSGVVNLSVANSDSLPSASLFQ